MATKQTLAALAVVVLAAVPFSLAADFVVGDENGWRPDFDYRNWAKGKNFLVGDSIVFRYRLGFHNVIPVSGAAFKECNSSGAPVVLTSGNDVVVLKSPGRKWYICGFGDHCTRGQKLVISVMPSITRIIPSPLPSPSSSSHHHHPPVSVISPSPSSHHHPPVSAISPAPPPATTRFIEN